MKNTRRFKTKENNQTRKSKMFIAVMSVVYGSVENVKLAVHPVLVCGRSKCACNCKISVTHRFL